MKVALLQTDIQWADREANWAQIEDMLKGHEDAELCVLPEMFSTGYAPDPRGVAEADCGTLEWMKRMAKRYDMAMCGSVATEVGGEYRNRCYFVKPDGQEMHYDKHHLFTYGGEQLKYTRGEERVVVEYKGVRILLQVCYDLRFPVFSRNRKDYDVAIYVANWPTARLEAWKVLLHARAIENQCYVMGVNRCGNDVNGTEHSGGTFLINPRGRTMAESQYGGQDVVTGEIDMEKLVAFRGKFPVLEDADC